MDRGHPIPITLQGPPPSASFVYLSRAHAARAQSTPNQPARPPSDLLKSIQAALRGSGTSSASPDIPEIHSSLHSFVDDTVGEEELTWDESTVCLSLGGVLRRKWAFGAQGETVRWACMGWIEQKMVSSAHYTSAAHQAAHTTPSDGAAGDGGALPPRPAFGPFARAHHQQRKHESERTLRIRAAYVFLRTVTKIYLLTGTTYTVALPFIVRKAWPAYPHGVIMQRCLDPKELEEAEVTGDSPLPSLFSLTSPFAELAAVGLTRGIVVTSPETPPKLVEDDEPPKPMVSVPASETVVWVSDPFGTEGPQMLAVTVDPEARRLSVWRHAYVPPQDLPMPLATPKGAQKAQRAAGPLAAAADVGETPPKARASHQASGLPPLSALPGMPPSLSTASTLASLLSGNPPPPPLSDVVATGEGRGRRDSHTRNELSMTMNRMALESTLDDIIPPIEESAMKAVYWLEKMYSEDLPEADAKAWQDITVGFFDQRYDGAAGRAMLAVCLPSSHSLVAFAITYNPDFSLSINVGSRLAARAVVSLYAIRPTCGDLVIIKPDHSLAIVTYGLCEVPLDLVSPPVADGYTQPTTDLFGRQRRRPCTLRDAARTTFTIVYDDGYRSRAAVDLIPQDSLTTQCLRVLSLTLPAIEFFALHRRFLEIWARRNLGHSVETEFESFGQALGEVFQISSSKPDDAQIILDVMDTIDPWQALSRSRSRFRFGDDPVLRNLSCPKYETTQPVASHMEQPHAMLAPLLNSLHLLAEDLRLTLEGHHDLLRLVPIICRIAVLIRPEWADYWKRFCPDALPAWPSPSATVIPHLDDRLPIWPIDMTAVLFGRINNPEWILAPHARNLGAHFQLEPCFAYGRVEPLPVLAQLTAAYMCLADNAVPDSRRRAENAVVCMAKNKLDLEFMRHLPLGVAAPLREAARTCQLMPAGNWSTTAYRLMDRQDLAEGVSSVPDRLYSDGYVTVKAALNPNKPRETVSDTIKKAHSAGAGESSQVSGVELDLEGFTEIRFGQDRRMEEVARMLCSSTVPNIKMAERPDMNEHEQARDQQHQVVRIAERTLALPYGRAMFTFGSVPTLTRESYSIPKIEYSIRIQPHNAVITPGEQKIPMECLYWGEFHNGVAAGLRIAPATRSVESSWIAFNRPSELTPEHAGFLFALGLTGHLKEMLTWQTFAYLTPKHDLTSIGVLLGLSAANAGSGNEHVTKLLAVHAPAMLPNPDVDLNVPLLTQTAALAGIGLLYIGTKKRHMAEVLLNEIRRKDLVQPDLTNEHREAYTLAAAFAFGMVMLGKGSSIPADVDMVERLRVLIYGEPASSTQGHRPSFDLNLTSPAATIALGLMYLRTERQDIADVLAIPDALVELHRIQPGFLLMRTVARALILWEGIHPTNEWIAAQVPPLLNQAVLSRAEAGTGDDALELAYFNILAGACFAIALKYAGTAREEAYLLVIYYYDLFSRMAYTNGVAFDQRIKRSAIREGLNLLSISLNMIMAGTGEINCLRRLRYAFGMYNQPIRYGTHISTHMSLGLLFLGGGRYTLGNSDAAVACMVAAFYPRFAQVSSDNRCYLQALRHLWVLAVEPRCLIARDVDTKEVVYLPVKIKIKDDKEKETTATQFIAPTLIPDLDRLQSIRVDTPRYWPFYLNVCDHPRHKQSLTYNQTLYVKRRSAFLSYMEDPKGSRSLFVRSGSSTADAATLDNPQLTDTKNHPSSDLNQFISSFSNDPFILSFADHLCREDGLTEAEKVFFAYCHASLLDTLLQDKPRASQSHLTLYHYRTMSPRSRYYNLRLHDLRFTADFYNKTFDRRFSGRYENNPRAPLLRENTVAGALHALDAQLEKVRMDPVFLRALGRYARGEPVGMGEPGSEEEESAFQLSWYLTRNSVPVSTLLTILKDLADKARAQCLSATLPEGTDNAHQLDQGIKEVIHVTGTQMTTTMGNGWSVRSLDEVILAWNM